MDPFTLHDGVLELDEGQGQGSGPRIVDPVAGLIRFADPSQNRPISDFIAVAVVYAEREVWVRVGNGRAPRRLLVHSVVLVPKQLPDDVAQLLHALETGGAPPVGFSILGAAAAVDGASLHFCGVGSALTGRRTAKAIAQIAHLPALELYGEFYVYRTPDRLDLSLRERLGRLPPPDPGAPPAAVGVKREDRRLELVFSNAPRRGVPWRLLALAAALVSVPLLVFARPLGVIVLVAALLMWIFETQTKRTTASQLIVEPDQIRWLHDGAEESFRTDALEMIRVSDDANLVLITHRDETRCPFGTTESAKWARRAIEHHLAPTPAPAYR